MKGKWLCMILVWLLVALPGSAGAQERKLLGSLKEGQGVTNVLKEAGCSILWLSRATKVTPVDPARYRQLPVGFEVFLDVPCSQKPSVAVSAASVLLMRNDIPMIANHVRSNAELNSLHDAITAANVEMDRLKAENSMLTKSVQELPEIKKQLVAAQGENIKLTADNKLLEAHLHTAQRTLEVMRSSENTQTRNRLLIFSVTLGAGVVIGGFFVIWLRRNRVRLPKVIVIRQKGQARPYEFQLIGLTAGLTGIYLCLRDNCNTPVPQDSLEQHILRVHAADRGVIKMVVN